MKPDIKKIFGQSTNTKPLMIIFMIGVALLLLPNLFGTRSEQSATQSTSTAAIDAAAYEKELEKRLAAILSTVSKVSDVSVMITLTDSGEAYYAQNEKSDTQTTNDGSLKENAAQNDASLALKNESGGAQMPVLLKNDMPRVSGVLVTARGVNDPTVCANVVKAVRAVLDVSAHRVSVLEKA